MSIILVIFVLKYKNNMKHLKSYDAFLNEAKGVLDILAPDLGGRIQGGRAYAAYSKAIDKLKAAGFKQVDSTNNTSQSNGNVNDTVTFQHKDSPTEVILHMYIGDFAKNNSFSYSFKDKPMVISIKNDKDYQERLSKYEDLSELKDVLYGIKINRYGWDETESVDKNIKDYVFAELRAITNYASKKTNIKPFLALGEKLQDDSEFNKFVESRGCKIIKNYGGKENIIRVANKYELKPNAETVTTAIDKNLFIDGRIGFAYITLENTEDVEYLLSQLLKIPPIF